jgi:putative membrane protein
MSLPIPLKRASLIAMILALGVVVGLVAWQGVGSIAGVLAVAGWQVLWLVPLFLLPLVAATASWRRLFPSPALAPSWRASLYGSWVGMAVNWLLPVAQVGGELVKARLVHRRGVDGNAAIASVVVDKTVQTVTQAAYTLVGLVCFALLYADQNVLLGSLVAAALMGLGAYGFYRAQQRGLFRWMAGAIERMLPAAREGGLQASAHTVDEVVRGTYARLRQLLVSMALNLLHRFLFVAEVWLALVLLGHPVGLVEAVILESLGQAVRAAAFLIPGGLGAQEGGYVLLGGALGLGPDVALSLALCKRVRELAVGLPALLAWQVEEGWRVGASAKRSSRTAPASSPPPTPAPGSDGTSPAPGGTRR